MSKLLKVAFRAIKVLAIAQFCYLLLVNAALQVDLTQDLVNRIRPEKFHVAWENAWSLYPFRVHARGVQVHGQARSQQWEVTADEAAGSISLLPLVAKRVNLRDVSAVNVDYRQRPRLKPDKDYSAVQAFFPPITGREIQPADTSPRKKKRPWKVSLREARASGLLSYWIYNLKGGGEGSAVADLKVESQGGPFSMNLREIDLQLAPAYLNDSAKLFHGGEVQGNLGFVPFAPRENKGLRMLPFLYVDADLDLEVGSLAFINLFTASLSDLSIGGAGRVRGRLHYDRGYMLAGTDLTASAADLAVGIRQMRILGQGNVGLSTPEQDDEPLVLTIGYDELTVTRDGDTAPFLRGDSLNLEYSGSNFVDPGPGLSLDKLMNDAAYRERREHSTLQLDIDDATLLNVAVLNDYMPAETALKFTGGTARLQADVFAGVEDTQGSVRLDGKDVEMQVDGQDLEGDLEVEVVIAGGVPGQMQLDLHGSSMLLDQVSVVGQEQTFDEEYWSARMLLTRAQVVLEQPLQLSADAALQVSDTRPLVTLFDNHRNAPKWVSRLLTLRDIEGEATLELADNRLEVTDAQVLSDKAEVAAKAVFHPDGREGVIYARYKKLDVVLKMGAESSDLDVFRARKKFDEYQLR